MVIANGFWLFLFALLFFVAVLIRNAFKLSTVKTKSLRDYYLWALILNVLLVVSLVFGLLDLFIPFVVLFVGVVIVSLFRFGASLRAQTEENENIASSARGEKLQFWDIFTRKGWIKLALHLGKAKATVVVFFVDFILLLILFFLAKIFVYTTLPVSTLIGDAFVFSAIGTFIFYQTIKKLG